MMDTQYFDLGTILSITTSKLLTKMDNVYKILDYMTGDRLFTHQLPRVNREMAPVILAQHPQLKDIDASGVNTENWSDFLAEQEKRFGKTLPIAPCGLFEHKKIDPQEELESMVAPNRIIIMAGFESEE